jgi:hypothetical protein
VTALPDAFASAMIVDPDAANTLLLLQGHTNGDEHSVIRPASARTIGAEATSASDNSTLPTCSPSRPASQ